MVEVPSEEEVEPELLPPLITEVEAQALAKSHKNVKNKGLYFCIIV